MDIEQQRQGGIHELRLHGRCDASGALALSKVFSKDHGEQALIVDMEAVPFISSAGLRELLGQQQSLKTRGGFMILCGLNAYCADVFEMTGLSDAFIRLPDMASARSHAARMLQGMIRTHDWDQAEVINVANGEMHVLPENTAPVRAEVTGDLKKILHSRVTEKEVQTTVFSPQVFSLGVGGMGSKAADCFSVLGDLMTLGPLMAWRATDTHHMPDYLAPREGAKHLHFQSAWQIEIPLPGQELMLFDSCREHGVTLRNLCRELFRHARQRRSDYHGVLALALRAQVHGLRGSTLKRAPIKDSAPANGKLITHASNAPEWFVEDERARHTQVSVLMAVVAANLRDDLSDFDETLFNRIFYLNPALMAGTAELLHSRAAVFNRMPMDARPESLEREARLQTEKGEFMDFCRVHPETEITRALISASSIQSFHARSLPEKQAVSPPEEELPPVIRKDMAYYKGQHLR